MALAKLLTLISGIAGGDGEFLLFEKGKPLYKVSPEQVINILLDEVEKL